MWSDEPIRRRIVSMLSKLVGRFDDSCGEMPKIVLVLVLVLVLENGSRVRALEFGIRIYDDPGP